MIVQPRIPLLFLIFKVLFGQPIPQYNTPLAGRNLELEARLKLELQNAILARSGGQAGMSLNPMAANSQITGDDAQFLYLMTQSPEAMLSSQFSLQNMRPIMPINNQLSQFIFGSPYGQLNSYNPYAFISPGGLSNIYGLGYPNFAFSNGYGLNSMNSMYPFSGIYPRGGLPVKR